MWAAVLLLLALAPAATPVFVPNAKVVEEFQTAKRWQRKGEDVSYVYRLHSPAKVFDGEKYPLLLWLHGARERGDDNLEQLRWLELVFEALPPADHDYFLLAVQCPENELSWVHADDIETDRGRAAKPVDPIDVATQVLEHIVANYSVDKDRIYVAGVSGGGSACWEIAMRHPQRFAAIVPMASDGGDLTRVADIKDVPAWAFHSLRDDMPADGVKRTVDALKQAGGNVELTIVDNAKHGIHSLLHEHDCWTGAIKYFDVMKWMFAQERGAMFAPVPGIRMWPWWNYVALGTPVATCWLVWLLEKKRRTAVALNSSQESSESEE